jgi:hypothetical protein
MGVNQVPVPQGPFCPRQRKQTGRPARWAKNLSARGRKLLRALRAHRGYSELSGYSERIGATSGEELAHAAKLLVALVEELLRAEG